MIRVERFCESSGGTHPKQRKPSDALERECMMLQAALTEHPLAAEPKRSD